MGVAEKPRDDINSMLRVDNTSTYEQKADLHVVVSEGLRVVPGVREPAERGFHLIAASPNGQRWVRVQTARLVGDLCPHLPKQPRFSPKGKSHMVQCIVMVLSLRSLSLRSERLQDHMLKVCHVKAQAKSTPARTAIAVASLVGVQLHAARCFIVSIVHEISDLLRELKSDIVTRM